MQRNNVWKFLSLTIIFTVVFVLSGCDLKDPTTWFSNPAATAPVTLTYWGVFEPKEVILPVIRDYEETHPNVKIDYSQRTFSNLSQYRELLLSRFKQTSGPDIARVHLSWVPFFSSELAPLPSKVMSEKDFKSTFYPSVYSGVASNGSIYALPLQYDGLALLINEDILGEVSGAQKPKTWEEFRQLAVKMTKIDSKEPDRILRAGAAIGNAVNISHASDIFSLMYLQSELSFPEDLTQEAAQHALVFYTNFMRKDRVWSAAFPNNIQAFARGQVGMIFAPSWRINEIISLNPALRFTVNPVPQLPAQEGREQTNVNFSSFWVEAVSNDSKNKEAAWEFLKYLSSKDSLKKLYALEIQGRPVGQPYPRTDLSTDLSVDPRIAPILAGAGTGKTTLLVDSSGNDIYTEAVSLAIESVVKGAAPSEALEILQKSIYRYLGLAEPPTPTNR